MGQKERDARDAELDAFWDIDALIPPRRASRYVHDTEATDLILEPVKKDRPTAETPIPLRTDEPERHYIPPHKPQTVEPDDEYIPSDSLIRQVRIYRQKSAYRYYEDFVRDALRLHPVAGATCPHVPFFSYVPQYSQMNRAQLEWYLWWRENFRRGEILTTDYSYLLLYAYEVINLADRIDPVEGQRALCRLWVSYREIFHQLDGYLPEWICDYSLIHHLPPPSDLTGQTLFTVMAHCRLREFYIASAGEEGLVRALMTLASEYDYRKSKFYTKENVPLYDKLIFGALMAVGRRHGEGSACFHIDKFAVNHVDREGYKGALCAHSIKCRIDLQYTSFYCSADLRTLITELIKYTENQIRASLGIRARLNVYTLGDEDKRTVDAYLAPHLPTRRGGRGNETREIPEYEKRYDLPRVALSLENANRIEQESWGTTERLMEAFEDAQPKETVPTVPMPAMPPRIQSFEPPHFTEDAFAASMHAYLPFLKAVLEKDRHAQQQAARRLGKMPELAADEINAIAADHIGDILLEECENGYGVIEDYLPQVQELIQNGKEDDHG